MRAHQATGLHGGFMKPEHFGEFFTTHGATMIFFVTMPFLTGLKSGPATCRFRC